MVTIWKERMDSGYDDHLHANDSLSSFAIDTETSHLASRTFYGEKKKRIILRQQNFPLKVCSSHLRDHLPRDLPQLL